MSSNVNLTTKQSSANNHVDKNIRDPSKQNCFSQVHSTSFRTAWSRWVVLGGFPDNAARRIFSAWSCLYAAPTPKPTFGCPDYNHSPCLIRGNTFAQISFLSPVEQPQSIAINQNATNTCILDCSSQLCSFSLFSAPIWMISDHFSAWCFLWTFASESPCFSLCCLGQFRAGHSEIHSSFQFEVFIDISWGRLCGLCSV